MASKYADDSEPHYNQRFMDIEPKPRRKLMPIQGYEDMPLVSLEAAVEPLVSIVHDVKKMATWAKWKRADPPANNLSVDQSASIIIYSMEWEPQNKCLYYSLNEALRDENRRKLKPWFLYLKLFITALGRLPPVCRTVYRGVRRDIGEEYQKGNMIIWWGFSSCTLTMDVLNSDQFLGSNGPRTLFAIECNSGRDIREHSAFKHENEVILPAARQFQVVACVPQGKNLNIIQLKELKPPVPLIDLPFQPTGSSTDPKSENHHSFKLATDDISQLNIGSSKNGIYTEPLVNSSEEFESVKRKFLDGWPDKLRRQVKVEVIHKINNNALEARFQQFVQSNPKYATQDCIGWHGTSSKCHDGSCLSFSCSLCQIIRKGFQKECARQNTSSYKCWGAATYFSNKSFVCHTYNGASANGTNRRCTIMTRINCGHMLYHEKFRHIGSYADYLIPFLVKKFKYDTVTFTRRYYVAPADYVLLYNDLAALPIYIVEYSARERLQIRAEKGEYCQFHGEYHSTSAGCDGHGGQSCLDGGCMDENSYSSFNALNESSPHDDDFIKSQYDSILKILGSTVRP